jgi:hypothetical protein
MAQNVSMTLDQTALATGFASMVLKELEEGQRDRIITEAIAHVIQPSDQGYGRTGPSILQQAFNQAIATLTHKVTAEIVADDPTFVELVTREVREAMNDVIENRSDLRAKVAQALVDAVW